MLAGCYRDVVTDGAGRRPVWTPWRPNLIVDGAFTLLAALLKREPETEGILYWAVGAGSESWDRVQPPTLSRTSRLVAELRRLEVPREAIAYVDARGAESGGPTPNLEVRLTFEWPDEAVTLREFGLFGGDAREQAGSGVMINHVIHRRVDLEPGQRLTRELRLSFGATGERRWTELPHHWLSDSEPRVVGGVGARYALALSAIGISTVDALANSDPLAAVAGISRVPLIELRSKARLALRTAAEIHPPEALHELTVLQVLRTLSSDLARDAGVLEAEVVRLREQLSTLELALDHRFLRRMTVRSLTGGAP